MQALITAGVDSFEKLASADPRRLEAITGRKFPYGDQLKASLNDAPPKVEMNLFESERDDQCLLTLHRVSQSQSSGKNFHMAELVRSLTHCNCKTFPLAIRKMTNATTMSSNAAFHQEGKSMNILSLKPRNLYLYDKLNNNTTKLAKLATLYIAFENHNACRWWEVWLITC